MNLSGCTQVVVAQKKELTELLGFETRNKYQIYDEKKKVIGYAAEQNKGFLGFLFRQALGHWRRFRVTIYDNDRREILSSQHPFRIFFQEFHVYDGQGVRLGYAKQRFGIFTKKFDVLNDQDQLLFEMRSGFFSFWTFPLKSPQGTERARIQKKWSGLLKEAFLDADNFNVQYLDPLLNENERRLVLALSIFVDLQYFERKS